jgi:hypothetical protein
LFAFSLFPNNILLNQYLSDANVLYDVASFR